MPAVDAYKQDFAVQHLYPMQTDSTGLIGLEVYVQDRFLLSAGEIRAANAYTPCSSLLIHESAAEGFETTLSHQRYGSVALSVLLSRCPYSRYERRFCTNNRLDVSSPFNTWRAKSSEDGIEGHVPYCTRKRSLSDLILLEPVTQ